jgi:hypothetical protein
LDKRQIAAVTGVLYYLQREAKVRAKEHALPSLYTLSGRWATYGRKTIMHLRSRVQRRVMNTNMPLPFVNVSVSGRGFALQRLKNMAITQNRFKPQKKYIYKKNRL